VPGEDRNEYQIKTVEIGLWEALGIRSSEDRNDTTVAWCLNDMPKALGICARRGSQPTPVGHVELLGWQRRASALGEDRNSFGSPRLTGTMAEALSVRSAAPGLRVRRGSQQGDRPPSQLWLRSAWRSYSARIATARAWSAWAAT
jgi:hypothetical protein